MEVFYMTTTLNSNPITLHKSINYTVNIIIWRKNNMFPFAFTGDCERRLKVSLNFIFTTACYLSLSNKVDKAKFQNSKL